MTTETEFDPKEFLDILPRRVDFQGVRCFTREDAIGFIGAAYLHDITEGERRAISRAVADQMGEG